MTNWRKLTNPDEILALNPWRRDEDGTGRSRLYVETLAIQSLQEKMREDQRLGVQNVLQPQVPDARRADCRNLVIGKKENLELGEQEKVARAVEEAVAMGLVREEVFPSATPNARVGYLLSGPHYSVADHDPTLTPAHVKQSQIQFFQLCHLLAKNGVTSRMRAEGREVGKTYTAFRGLRPEMEIGGRIVDALSPEGQQFLFDHPDVLQQLMDHQQLLAKKTGMSTPVFYAYASGMNFAGAHTPQTEL